ncbi:unnamed protein product [Mytilus coruscus]|uniref:DUF4371 domain-containing protein n=1 Tax=Mytilus coruscus TaxID=42192 RepID=A0A6J8BGN0_MYTCO|nr:unnamed protein product [Mytilus coruscus]
MNKTDLKERFKKDGKQEDRGCQLKKKNNNLMSCTWCEQQWTTAKLETSKSHETSNIHIKNRDIIAGKSKAAGGIETEAMKCVESLNKAVFFGYTSHVAKSDASGIIEAMKRFVEKLDVPWDDFTKKLVGIGSDGASVMLGCNNGVATHLRRIQPVMVAVHCYSDKLELAFKDAIKHVSLDSKVTTCLLQGLYFLYHNSALNRQSNEIQHLTWQRVNRMFPDGYCNILAVMDLILTIPGSSSECERGSRHMKSLKTTFRTCLSEDSLASQMCIKLHSPSIEEKAKNSVNSDINEAIAKETESQHVDQEVTTTDDLSVEAAIVAAADKHSNMDLVQDDEDGADSDDQFSENEDYGNEGRVFRVMCLEGLIEE